MTHSTLFLSLDPDITRWGLELELNQVKYNTYRYPESGQVGLLPEADQSHPEHDGGHDGAQQEEDGVCGHQSPMPSEVTLQGVHGTEPGQDEIMFYCWRDKTYLQQRRILCAVLTLETCS